jgi:ABC-type glutathione transport system ATPase component
MARASIAGIRTLALVGQAGAGKTSLAEALRKFVGVHARDRRAGSAAGMRQPNQRCYPP